MPNLNVHVWVDGKDAAIQYRGRSGCCTGDDQIVFVVPAGVEGCALPVYVQIDNTVSNFVTMAVGSGGAQCINPNALTPAQIQTATQNGGIRSASLAVTHYDGLAGTTHEVSDGLQAVFAKTPLSALSGFSAVVPVGNCIVYQFPVPAPTGTNTYLDAGNISVSGAVGPYNLYSASTGAYSLSFLPGATSSPGEITDGTVLGPGNYTFTGSGGADVGAFTASINYVNTFKWDQSSVPSTHHHLDRWNRRRHSEYQCDIVAGSWPCERFWLRPLLLRGCYVRNLHAPGRPAFGSPAQLYGC
jgi:hypothetical protein